MPRASPAGVWGAGGGGAAAQVPSSAGPGDSVGPSSRVAGKPKVEPQLYARLWSRNLCRHFRSSCEMLSDHVPLEDASVSSARRPRLRHPSACTGPTVSSTRCGFRRQRPGSGPGRGGRPRELLPGSLRSPLHSAEALWTQRESDCGAGMSVVLDGGLFLWIRLSDHLFLNCSLPSGRACFAGCSPAGLPGRGVFTGQRKEGLSPQ